MKQKRTYVTLLLIVAFLVLGIAYALIESDELQITGTATAGVADGTVDVEFTAAAPEKTEGATNYAEIDGTDKDKATFTVSGLTTVDDTKTVTFTIVNKTENGIPVTLQTPTVKWGEATTHEWLEVSECTYGNSSLAAAGEDGDSTTLTVTVRLKKTVATADDETAANTNNTVTITLNAVAANS